MGNDESVGQCVHFSITEGKTAREASVTASLT